jgi:hypothetical protein
VVKPIINPSETSHLGIVPSIQPWGPSLFCGFSGDFGHAKPWGKMEIGLKLLRFLRFSGFQAIFMCFFYPQNPILRVFLVKSDKNLTVLNID